MEAGTQGPTAGSQSQSVPSLAGLSGRIRVDVAGDPASVLVIHDGTVSVRPAAGTEDADAVLKCDTEDTLAAFRRGQLNPVVAMLQGLIRTEGDRALAIRVILGLQAVFAPPPASARVLKADGGVRKDR
jgi:putative sterol carrier protein